MKEEKIDDFENEKEELEEDMRIADKLIKIFLWGLGSFLLLMLLCWWYLK
jgi:hypothetical protein